MYVSSLLSCVIFCDCKFLMILCLYLPLSYIEKQLSAEWFSVEQKLEFTDHFQ